MWAMQGTWLSSLLDETRNVLHKNYKAVILESLTRIAGLKAHHFLLNIQAILRITTNPEILKKSKLAKITLVKGCIPGTSDTKQSCFPWSLLLLAGHLRGELTNARALGQWSEVLPITPPSSSNPDLTSQVWEAGCTSLSGHCQISWVRKFHVSNLK